MLIYTKVELELFQDNDKYLFIEEGIWGGICAIRHAKTNNSYKSDTPISFFGGFMFMQQIYMGLTKPLPPIG